MVKSQMRFAVTFIIFLLGFCFRTFASEPKISALPEAVHSIPSKNLDNFYSLTETIFSGSSPLTENAFQELQTLGIKTIISVDGSKPEVEMARKFGIRYIHLPIGYNGTTRSNEVRIVKAAGIAEGRLYIHCHHGQHRGPAAAAMVCQSVGGWSPSEAVAWLKKAGTSPDYPKLFTEIESFKKPSEKELAGSPDTFPEQTEISSLVDTMVSIDNTWENLKAVQKAGFKRAADHPDLEPVNEAMQLREAFRELARTPEAQAKGPEFLSCLKQAENDAMELHTWLKTKAASRAQLEKGTTLVKGVSQSCSACHRKFRN